MKSRFAALLLAGIMTLSLVACGQQAAENTASTSEPETIVEQPSIPEGVLAIAEQGMFSAGGTVITSDGTFDVSNYYTSTTANNTDTNVSNNNVTDDNTDDSADITPEESTAGDSNILVAYFSWSGNTQQVANWISDKTGGELFRIIPEVEYTEDDVFDRAQDELNNGTRPPLSSHIDQEVMEQYDVIFVGFPIWWYDLPMPVWSFLEEYDLSGKTIIPFFTHNGSSSGASSISTVAELCPDSTVLTDDYFTYSGNNVDEAESAVDEWLTELGYNN